MASNITVDTSSSTDQTVKIFDNFYNTKLSVNASDYDVVYSFFKGASNNSITAANFSALLFRIAQESGNNVIELLNLLQGTSNKLQMTSVMCYYLNTLKSKSSQYGVGNIPQPNQSVQRNVIQ
jgi:hypothetical protein